MRTTITVILAFILITAVLSLSSCATKCGDPVSCYK